MNIETLRLLAKADRVMHSTGLACYLTSQTHLPLRINVLYGDDLSILAHKHWFTLGTEAVRYMMADNLGMNCASVICYPCGLKLII